MQESEEIPFDAFVIGEYESALLQAYLRHHIEGARKALQYAIAADPDSGDETKDAACIFWETSLANLQGLLGQEKQRKISDGIVEADDAVGYTKGKMPGGESGE